MDIVEDLVIAPFKEAVEKGNMAVENAGEAQDLIKMSQRLVKDAEKILKRIEPLCTRLLVEYGSNFIDALKENDEIAEYRLQLNDLLWDFDDYVQVDEFEKEKVVELQLLSRKAGLKIEEILKRMKLEPVAISDPIPTPTSPQPPTEPSLAELQPTITPDTILSLPILQQTNPTVTETQQMPLMESRSGPDEGFEVVSTPLQVHEVPSVQEAEEEPQEPPRSPETNPWDLAKTPSVDTGAGLVAAGTVERRAPVSSIDSPVELDSSPSPYIEKRFSYGSSRRLDSGVDMWQDEGDRTSMAASPDISIGGNDRARSSISQTDRPTMSGRMRQPSATLSPSIPENSPLQRGDDRGTLPSLASHRYSQSSSIHSHPSRQRSQESMQSSVLDGRRNDGTTSPVLTENRTSTFSVHDSANFASTNAPLSPISRVPTNPQNLSPQPQPGLELVVPTQQDDDGLIPVETEIFQPSLPKVIHEHREADCSIGLSSSFYLYKGFCEGAKEVMRGGIGVKKMKKPGFSGTFTVAKCSGCFFELEFGQIELDIGKSDEVNFTTHGIGFRLRFLQKSHIATKRQDEQLYGCLFCIHAQKTLDPCDATVFFSQKKLFEHIARHPRPLPHISGLTVVEEAEIPFNLLNNYDIHFKIPTEPSALAGKQQELAQLPTGTAKETTKKMYGMRLLSDKTPAFELAVGGRISGVEYPVRYNGEWCLGWHDGYYASCPADVVKLDPPPQSEVRMGGTSNIRAQARWKFAPKEKDGGDWLKFDKGEVITNISWVYQDHWCWSGTNKKGKWGIFPQTHIDTNTLQELSINSDRSSIISTERRRSDNMLSRFSIRKGSGRPPSMAESTSSRETPTSPQPRGYY